MSPRESMIASNVESFVRLAAINNALQEKLTKVQKAKKVSVKEVQVREVQVREVQAKKVQAKKVQVKEVQVKEVQVNEVSMKEVQVNEVQVKEVSMKEVQVREVDSVDNVESIERAGRAKWVSEFTWNNFDGDTTPVHKPSVVDSPSYIMDACNYPFTGGYTEFDMIDMGLIRNVTLDLLHPTVSNDTDSRFDAVSPFDAVSEQFDFAVYT